MQCASLRQVTSNYIYTANQILQMNLTVTLNIYLYHLNDFPFRMTVYSARRSEGTKCALLTYLVLSSHHRRTACQ